MPCRGCSKAIRKFCTPSVKPMPAQNPRRICSTFTPIDKTNWPRINYQDDPGQDLKACANRRTAFLSKYVPKNIDFAIFTFHSPFLSSK